MTERLPSTEAVDGGTTDIDRVDTATRVRRLIEAQRGAIDAALAASDAIAQAVDAVVAALRNGRRVIVLGAGTSGRLAVLDASELPPTFGFAAERYDGRIAGGVRNFHFYTLNRADLVLAICAALGVRPVSPVHGA